MFLRLETQWRIGFDGASGLDYNAAKALFELFEVEDRRGLFEAIMIMERAALAAWAERKSE